MCPRGYHHNGFFGTHALRRNRISSVQVHELPQSHCGDKAIIYYICIYIIYMYIILYIYYI